MASRNSPDPEALVDLIFAAHRRSLLEVAGASETLHELPAFGAPVPVENGEGRFSTSKVTP